VFTIVDYSYRPRLTLALNIARRGSMNTMGCPKFGPNRLSVATASSAVLLSALSTVEHHSTCPSFLNLVDSETSTTHDARRRYALDSRCFSASVPRIVADDCEFLAGIWHMQRSEKPSPLRAKSSITQVLISRTLSVCGLP
jgi:hypothetical protein